MLKLHEKARLMAGLFIAGADNYPKILFPIPSGVMRLLVHCTEMTYKFKVSENEKDL